MNGDYEKEIMQHPEVALIPKPVWEHYFRRACSPVPYHLMHTKSDELEAVLKSLTLSFDEKTSNTKRLLILLAIVYSHQDLTDDLIIHFAELLQLPSYELFMLAAFIGKLGLLNRVISLDAEVINPISYTSYNPFYEAFILAAKNGQPSIMERLIELAPGKVQEMITAGDYKVFWTAADEGHLSTMERLIELVPGKVQEMVAAYDYWAFCMAAMHGHLSTMERLMQLARGKVQEMIAAHDYWGFRYAAGDGHLAIVERLIELAPGKLQEMIAASDYGAFRMAARDGHLAIVERLIELAPGKLQEMIAASDYGAFRKAAWRGNLAIMERLIELATDKVQEMIAAAGDMAFCYVIEYGYLAIMERFLQLPPGKVQEMITAQDYAAFRKAAEKGNLAIVERLMQIAPDKVQEMIAARDYEAFRMAAAKENLALMERLIELSPDAFAYAEAHDHEYGDKFVYPFVAKKLASLHQQQTQALLEHPHAVFDLPHEEAKLCFYIIRSLIRRNDPALLNEIRFLLEIPSIKALAHQEITAYRPNELLRLAMSIPNQDAAALLLTIPAVRALAAENHYYQQERHAGIDLQRLAMDRESSMTALTEGEQSRLSRLIRQYQPQIESRGVAQVMDALRQQLRARYAQHPATIMVSDKTITLPVDYASFMQLNLAPQARAQALKAYYQNKDHTALRYLSRPNFWMADNASYVYVNPDNLSEKWSTFEEYQPLIAMLWLAASDKDTPLTEGFTLEGRIDHFVDELAHLGRAHNWDRSRTRVGPDEKPITEEYDDLEGDKPSCFSGVKRRLFQSLVGHPLITILTTDCIQQEIRAFVRSLWAKQITTQNCETLKGFWDKYIEELELSAEARTVFATFNVSKEQQQQLLTLLNEKYGAPFDETLKQFTLLQLSLQPNLDAPYESLHVFKLDGLAQFSQLLEFHGPKKEVSNTTIVSEYDKAYEHVCLVQQTQQDEKIKGILDNILKQVKTLHQKGDEPLHLLIEALNNTALRLEHKITPKQYEESAQKMQGHGSTGLKILGGFMLALGIAALVLGIVFFPMVSVAAAALVGTAAATAVAGTAVGVTTTGFFAGSAFSSFAGWQKGLAKDMSDLNQAIPIPTLIIT